MSRVAKEPLHRADFRKIASNGFGDRTTRIAQSMAWFSGAIYVGTGGRSLNPMGLSDAALAQMGPFARLALASGKAPKGASVWRYSIVDKTWAQVFQSPTIDYDSGPGPRDRNVRAALVMAEADGSESLYFGVSAMKGRVRFVRTTDGVNFEEGPNSGLGLPDGADIPSIRSLVHADGWVYTSPVGMIEGRGMLDDNMSAYPMVFRAPHPFADTWDAVSAPGFGDDDNLSVNEIAVISGYFYAGTLNIRTGAQLWRCPLDDMRPERWEPVFRNGAGLGPSASIVSAMCPFGEELYVATGLQRQGKTGIDRYGPISGELIRVAPSGNWQLICGQNRITEEGWKPPLSELSGSFAEATARGIWHLAEHNGWLYAGGGDWRLFQTYLPPPTSRLPETTVREINQRHDAYEGGFPLWCSRDGVNWVVVTHDGFEPNPETGGARFLQSSSAGLFVGTASSGKTEEFGGVQVWYGSRDDKT